MTPSEFVFIGIKKKKCYRTAILDNLRTLFCIRLNARIRILHVFVLLWQHCTIVDHTYNQTIISVIISKHYNQHNLILMCILSLQACTYTHIYMLVEAEKAIPLHRKIIICTDIVSELLFLQMHYKIEQKYKYI